MSFDRAMMRIFSVMLAITLIVALASLVDLLFVDLLLALLGADIGIAGTMAIYHENKESSRRK